jgi:hypothetical protein
MKQRTKICLVAALTLLAASAPVRAEEDPVALVIRVQGEVSVRHGDADAVPIAVGERMYVGDVVLPGAGARAILITRTGGQQIITEETTLTEPRTAGNPDIFARAMSTLAQAASIDVTAGGRQGMIRPLTCGIAPVAPRNGLLVSSPTPTFEWTGAGDQSYDLMLRNVAGGRPEIFEVGSDTAFTVPENAGLTPGATYAWTVFVGGRRGGRPCEQQEFRVMSLEESVDLADYMDEIAVFGLDPMTDGLFLTVVAYRDLGLYYEAHDALVTVERQASLSADLYLLKGEILVELGHEEAARAAFDQADQLMR